MTTTVGFNVQPAGDIRDKVFREFFGIDFNGAFTSEEKVFLDQIKATLSKQYHKNNTAEKASYNQDVIDFKAALTKTLNDWKKAYDQDATGPNPHKKYTFEPPADFVIDAKDGKTAEERVKDFFNKEIASTFEAKLNAKLADVPYSRERVVLLSLAYNDGDPSRPLIGQKLKAAITAGNRAEAWYEIRFNTDKQYKRRYVESELFGLFKDSANVTKQEAIDALRAYSAHRENILTKQDAAGTSSITNANGDLVKIATLSSIASGLKVENINLELAPALNYIKQNGLTEAHLDGSLLTAVRALDGELFLAGNGAYNIGSAEHPADHADALIDFTNDNNILNGGNGRDYYILGGNFGRDIIKDSDGDGGIYIDGVQITSLVQSAIGSNVYYDNVDNPTRRAVFIDEGDTQSLIISTVTKSGKNIINSGNSVTVKNWSNGKLGLNLQNAAITSAADSRTINGDGNNNAITLENLKDTNGTYTAGITALYANGGAGRDIIMGNLSTDDILLGGDDSDIISGGFIDNLTDAAYASKMLPTGMVSGKDWIDGGKGNDFIFASIGGGVAHGGDDNDVLSSDSGAYFLFNKQDAATLDPAKYNAHGALKRDDIWGDIIAQHLSFEVTKNNDNVYTYNPTIEKNLTENFTEYTGSITGAHYIGKRGATSSSYSSGGFGLGYTTSQTYAYDYNKENGTYSPVDNANHVKAINFAVSTFSLGAGHTYAEYANQPGGNLFGDKGNDSLFGGMFADNLSGGDDNDVIFGESGHDIIDGGTGIDTVYGGDGNDLINGGDGDDSLAGSVNSDNLAADVGDNDTIFGGKGEDWLYGGRGDDYLEGGTGTDHLYGEKGNDYLFGGDDAEQDQLVGSDGNDTLVLYRNDIADGGTGNNIYIYNTHQVTTAPLPVMASAALPHIQLDNANTSSTNSNNTALANVLNSTATDTTAQAADLTYIFNAEGQNTLALVGVDGLDGFDVALIDGQLQLSDSNQKLVIANAATATPLQLVFGNSIEEFMATPYTEITDDHFLNGIAPLEQLQLNTADIILANHASPVALTGLTANQYLAGGLVNDTLTANSQGTRFIGGRGDDTLLGSTADDTYLIRKGDGNDTIIEQGGNNHIKLDKNINAVGHNVISTYGKNQRWDNFKVAA